LVGGAAEAGRAELPDRAAAETLAGWLAGARSRALRRARIGPAESVLEVGCGHCVVTGELLRRARGEVVCLDRLAEPLTAAPEGVRAVCGDARSLPLSDNSFDLVFFQNVLLWVSDIEEAIGEAGRVLQPGGALVAVEPDYGGMMEQPYLGLGELWLSGLQSAGADPLVGRKLPAACAAEGLEVWVELSHLPQQADPRAVQLLDDLPLEPHQRQVAAAARAALQRCPGGWRHFIHVPYFLIVAHK
jgi:SAM-dependent methyltransferase